MKNQRGNQILWNFKDSFMEEVSIIIDENVSIYKLEVWKDDELLYTNDYSLYEYTSYNLTVDGLAICTYHYTINITSMCMI